MEQRDMSIVSFTPGGSALAERIRMCLTEDRQTQGERSWKVAVFHKPSPLQDWCREQFRHKDAILFIGAMGIAVRTIAPFLENKIVDPAVLVMDEKGRYVISVLSGHLGGGNELCLELARILNADPVITTASDVNSKLAVDVFAKKNNLVIADMRQAKAAAAAIVAEKPVYFVCDGPVRGRIPRELTVVEPETQRDGSCLQQEGFYICVTARKEPFHSYRLQLIPKACVLGLGCKTGKSVEEIERLVLPRLSEEGIAIESIAGAATIDLKRQEDGLLKFCDKYHLPITFYSARQLLEVPGSYSSSDFVAAVTGVDNVCERAAMRRILEEFPHCRKEDCMIIEKTKSSGVTMALARRDWSVSFE